MKRSLVVLLLASALIVPAFGQDVPWSLQNLLTAGTTYNEIDQAFHANADFGAYADSFIFGGLGNPGLDIRASTAITSPARFGYYMAGSFPLSLYSSVSLTAAANRPLYDSAVVGNVTTTPTESILFRDHSISAQALAKLGPATVGLYIKSTADNSALDVIGSAAKFATVVTRVLDGTVYDYSVTESTTNSATGLGAGTGNEDRIGSLQFALPFAMKTGDLEHRAAVGATFGWKDKSLVYELSETAHAVTNGGTIEDLSIKTTDKKSDTGLSLDYTLLIPAGKASDKWIAKAQFGMGIHSGEYESVTRELPYDATTLNQKTAIAGGSQDNDVRTFASTTDMSGSLTGGRSFSYQPASAVSFVFVPSLSMAVSNIVNGGNTYEATRIAFTQTLNAGGTHDGSGYTRTTTTTTGTPGSALSIGGTLSLPMGLTVKPEGWKFGFLLGAMPALSMTAITTTTDTFGNTVTSETFTGGAVSASATVTTAGPAANKSTRIVPSFAETHFIGITVPFGGGARFDAQLNGNLLAFESFTIQALIPLK